MVTILTSIFPYKIHLKITEMICDYLGEEPHLKEKGEVLHRQFFIMDRTPFSISPSQVLNALGKNRYKQVIDKEHQIHGEFVYDLGLHGKQKEPGFIFSVLAAYDYAIQYPMNKGLGIPLYVGIHKKACQHFTGDSRSATEMSSEKAGEFSRATMCGGDHRALFEGFSEPIARNLFGKAFPEATTQEIFDHVKDNEGVIILSKFTEQSSSQEFSEKVEKAKSWKKAYDLRIDERLLEIDAYITKRSKELGLSSPIAHFYRRSGEQVTCHYDCEFGKEEAVVKALFKEFNDRMKAPQSRYEQIRCIADLFQMLEWTHPFPDGQGRTDLILLSKSLAEFGFNPPILEHPYVSTFSTLDEWVDCLINGMINWQKEATEMEVAFPKKQLRVISKKQQVLNIAKKIAPVAAIALGAVICTWRY